MEAFDTGGEEFAEIFVKDEFYESFEAPKFHDFTAPEEEAGDPDAWFSETSDPRAGGMTTKETIGAQENSSLLQIPPKTQQILVLEQKKAVIADAHKSAPVSSNLLLGQTSSNFSAAKKMDVSSSSSSSSPWCLLAFINSSLKILQTAHPFTSCWTTTSLGSKF
ncbi:hypothetical protein BDL97_11G012000 [Sphagnum fallax]|nr:hypothetical protein BDL97_11G012000 [Sphagnum fallax]